MSGSRLSKERNETDVVQEAAKTCFYWACDRGTLAPKREVAVPLCTVLKMPSLAMIPLVKGYLPSKDQRRGFHATTTWIMSSWTVIDEKSNWLTHTEPHHSAGAHQSTNKWLRSLDCDISQCTLNQMQCC